MNSLSKKTFFKIGQIIIILRIFFRKNFTFTGWKVRWLFCFLKKKVLVETQLCGRPVIGTDSGGIPDIIEDEKTGLLVKPKDPLDLAKAMEKILKDYCLAEKLAERGYRQAVSKFSPEAIQEKFLEFISLD